VVLGQSPRAKDAEKNSAPVLKRSAILMGSFSARVKAQRHPYGIIPQANILFMTGLAFHETSARAHLRLRFGVDLAKQRGCRARNK